MGKPIYIVGPCAAESREQVLETARQIIDVLTDCSADRGQTVLRTGRLIFRAGVWKPRTNPSSFQGAGEEALEWLQEVKGRFGVPVATEVATPEHVQAALKAGIDYLWIGARTAANPIAVQEIADAIANAIGIQNTDYSAQTDSFCTPSAELSVLRQPKAVLIKNPVNADAALWLGNIERLEKTGVPVMVIHRGCGHQPCWSMAHAVRTARPDIPMLLDPSHMSGDAAKVPELLHEIAELGLDGVMVEVHAHPEVALSDGKQQVKPSAISGQLSVIENMNAESTNPNTIELNWLRAEMDEIDERLWATIAARMDMSQRIGVWKKAHQIAPLQPERYHQIVERIEARGERQEAKEFMLRVWELIHEESVRVQQSDL